MRNSRIPCGKTAAGQDDTHIQACRHRIHHAAAADAARRRAADHLAFEDAVAEEHVRDGSGRGPHAHADGGGLEGRPGGGGSAEYPVPVAQGDLAVGAEIDQGSEPLAVAQAHGNDPCENIGADEAAQAGEESYAARGRQGPIELFGSEMLLAVIFGRKWGVRQRLDIQAGEQVVHYRIADQDHLAHFRGALAGQCRSHFPDGVPDQRRQCGAGQGKQHPAHHVRAVSALRIERRAHSEHLAGRQVEQLRGNRSRPDIDGNSEACAAGPLEPGGVDEHGRHPLSNLELQRRFGTSTACQAPALRQFLFGKNELVADAGGQLAFDHAHTAPAAQVRSAAGKLHALFREDIGKRGPARHFDAHAQGHQFDKYRFLHSPILPQDRRLSAAKVGFLQGAADEPLRDSAAVSGRTKGKLLPPQICVYCRRLFIVRICIHSDGRGKSMEDNATTAAEAAPMTFFQRLIGIYFEPAKTLRTSAGRRSWLLMFLLLCIVTIGVNYTLQWRMDPVDAARKGLAMSEPFLKKVMSADQLALAREQAEKQALQPRTVWAKYAPIVTIPLGMYDRLSGAGRYFPARLHDDGRRDILSGNRSRRPSGAWDRHPLW